MFQSYSHGSLCTGERWWVATDFSSPISSFRSVKRCFFLLIFLKMCFLNVQVCFAYIYVCIPCVYVACGGQEKVSDSLELKLQMVVSHYADARNQTWVFCKSSKCF